jgi:tetratricopeptide (TPR) repeat protein
MKQGMTALGASSMIVLLLQMGSSTQALSSAGTTTTAHQQQQKSQEKQQPQQQANSLIAELVSGDIPWNSLVGEADRAFRLGVQLEKNGQARKASAAFHEAATLYQCYADSKSEFGHVTCLSDNNDDCSTILAYTSLRLASLNLDAIGDPTAAVRLYQLAVDTEPIPSDISYDGLGVSLEAAGSSLDEAATAYRKALELNPENRRVMFHLAVALERLGDVTEGEAYMEQLRRDESKYACLVDSWGYIRWHTRNVRHLNLYRGTRSLLELALVAAMPLIQQGGLVCEFGVGSGRSLRMTQEILPLNTELHGFDTFTGLPQPWGVEPIGSYSTGGAIPNMEGRVYFYKGLFKNTLAPFLEKSGSDAFLAFANIDCELYSSTLDVLEAMHGRIVPGTVLVFDEYVGHPTWRQDEFRAWRECCKRSGWKYEYLAFSLSTCQAVVRVIDA